MKSRLPYIAAAVIFLLGAVFRLASEPSFRGIGPDAALYSKYITMLDKVGLSGYPQIAQVYIEDQRDPRSIAKLPPTRFLYIFTSWVVKHATFGDTPRVDGPAAATRDPAWLSLRRVSCAFSILSVGLIGLAAWRMLGPPVGLGAMALMAASPLSVHMGAHALIDGFFAFWATLCLWLLWENLQRPNDWRRLTALGFALALMVTTKENAFFVYVSLCGLVVANRWAKFGATTRPLILVGVLGPLAGLLVLVTLAGGIEAFVEIYRTLVTKAQTLGYAIATGDGPWHRYLIELLTLDPLVLLLALSGIFTLPAERRPYLFLLGFVALSYLIMCNVRYGMNLRYTTIWALPLTAFAAAQLIALALRAGSRAAIVAVVLFSAVCAYDLRQFRIFFIDSAIYEPSPVSLFQALKIIKEPPSR